MRVLAIALLALGACNVHHDPPGNSSAIGASTNATVATSSPTTSIRTTARPSASELSVNDLPDLASDVTISIADFDSSNTLDSCLDFVALVRPGDGDELTDWTKSMGAGTRLREPCEKAFADRKVLARCEVDREAWLAKAKPSTTKPKAKFVSLTVLFYAHANDASMKDCFTMGGKWTPTPP